MNIDDYQDMIAKDTARYGRLTSFQQLRDAGKSLNVATIAGVKDKEDREAVR